MNDWSEVQKKSHVYLSTSCFHGQHHYCANIGGVASPKVPATCKFCPAECVCNCHKPEPPEGWESEHCYHQGCGNGVHTAECTTVAWREEQR